MSRHVDPCCSSPRVDLTISNRCVVYRVALRTEYDMVYTVSCRVVSCVRINTRLSARLPACRPSGLHTQVEMRKVAPEIYTSCTVLGWYNSCVQYGAPGPCEPCAQARTQSAVLQSMVHTYWVGCLWGLGATRM